MSSHDEQESKFFSSEALSDEFFIEIIERKLNIARDKFKVRLVLITPATGKNENYLSVVYRAKINVELLESNEKRVVNAFIKAMILDNVELKEWNVFIREKFLYENVIASFESIWKERANEDVKFGPKCLKVAEEPYDLLVLDDLKADGYQMLNRKVGVDVQQAKLVLSKLAKFHAASAIRYQTHGEISEKLDRKSSLKIFEPDTPLLETFKRTVKAFQRIIEELEGFEKVAESISKWDAKKLSNFFYLPAEPMKSGFKILNHGDDWVNNMMFKLNNDGSAESVMLLDYQISYWGSPIGDLYYFIISSMRDDIKTGHFDELVEHYHCELVDSLKQLKYDGYVPTLEEIQIESLERRQYVAALLIEMLFAVKNDSSDELTLEHFMDTNAMDDDELMRIYKDKNYLKALMAWLPFLHERGFLEQ